ncbi:MULTISPECIES: GTP cyclohydrolase I FolE [unclassified Shewanella]|uniref:GTP cyclohydrolase I FolE n=1 Tax=unclassified Shewanella TaxID=196818 RepID=UPI000C854420|nr:MULTISPECIES: GTP cyclohydrolase I FolE [unclassified Shewanella]MDO6619765.1 GTP cyclohydrolase I FolE [Shewanella sp. 6_MG-2023]MDO6638695.1 GTP cyclohydrolase I FolE [Shewanella sp. 5_MG-2023]MDO6680174.1 GTP cyclohydrolase I FolE [Shewanella sp. 4_MG-2023]MDO6774145.1 GTP cyclohydrolase I FolE [Shewanella sp. 3_MG-2023]PMG32158.1 GTP cyclohydrolase I FolE [Shewanella sp. 10N.286.52.C2]
MISEEARKVQQVLIERGLETPVVENDMTNEQKVARIQGLMTEVISTLGLDLTDDSLCETPHRIAKMYVNEIFSGLDYNHFPKVTQIDNKMGVDEMVKVSDISVVSTCEHHFITIDGVANVAYVPGRKIIGLSKINRIVKFFAQRPQVQERLTQQVLVALQTLLETDDVAISINATHYCVKSRGIMDTQSYTKTSALGGCFKANPASRAEFFANS